MTCKHLLVGLLLVACLIAPLPLAGQTQGKLSDSQRWTVVVESDDLTAFIDNESVTTVPVDVTEIWVLFEYAKPEGTGGKKFDATLSHWQLKCAERHMKPTQAQFYLRTKQIHSEALYEDWESPAPGSVNEAVFRRGCAMSASTRSGP